MSSEGAIAGVVVGVTVGIISAYAGIRVHKELQDQVHQDEILDAKLTAYRQGWNEASTNHDNIMKRYQEIFEPTTKKGTSFK